MKAIPPSAAERAVRAQEYQACGQRELEKPSTLLGRSPMRRARPYFDKAVQMQPDCALSIGDHLLRLGALTEGIRYKEMAFGRTAMNSPLRAPLATQIGDAYLQASHESRLAFSKKYDRSARRYFEQAIEADWGYYGAHMGRYSTYIDEYHHSKRVSVVHRREGDIYLLEQALIEWSTVLTQAPQAVVKEWLRQPGDLFEQPATPRTQYIYRDHIVPALGYVLVPPTGCPSPDEELTRLALQTTRRLFDAEAWTIPLMTPYLLDCTETGGLTSENLPDLLRVYDKMAHVPLPEGQSLADAATRLRRRFKEDSGAMLQLVALQKIMLEAYSQQPKRVLGCLYELSKLARDHVPVAFDALDLMLTTVVTQPDLAPTAIDLVAQRAAKVADQNLSDSDALVFHIIDEIRRLAEHPRLNIKQAAAVALQGPLKKYYDEYRAAEEDARRAREQAETGGEGAGELPPDGSVPPAGSVPEQQGARAEKPGILKNALVLAEAGGSEVGVAVTADRAIPAPPSPVAVSPAPAPKTTLTFCKPRSSEGVMVNVLPPKIILSEPKHVTFAPRPR